MESTRPLLLVDDSPRDMELVLNALEVHKVANRIVTLRDGAEALDYLYRRGAYINRPPGYPAFVLLDLKMPKVDGLEVLRQIKSDPRLKSIPVVVMTSSREEQDLVDSYDSGVNAYVVKPIKLQEFIEVVKYLGAFWAILNEPPVIRSLGADVDLGDLPTSGESHE